MSKAAMRIKFSVFFFQDDAQDPSGMAGTNSTFAGMSRFPPPIMLHMLKPCAFSLRFPGYIRTRPQGAALTGCTHCIHRTDWTLAALLGYQHRLKVTGHKVTFRMLQWSSRAVRHATGG